MAKSAAKKKIKVLVVGLGNMGASHAKAYHKLEGFEIVGLMSRSIKKRKDLPVDNIIDGSAKLKCNKGGIQCQRRRRLSR